MPVGTPTRPMSCRRAARRSAVRVPTFEAEHVSGGDGDVGDLLAVPGEPCGLEVGEPREGERGVVDLGVADPGVWLGFGVAQRFPHGAMGVVQVVEQLPLVVDELADENRVELPAGTSTQLRDRAATSLAAAEQLGDVGHLDDTRHHRHFVARLGGRTATAVPAFERIRCDRRGCGADRQQPGELLGRVALGCVMPRSGDRTVAENCVDGSGTGVGWSMSSEPVRDQRNGVVGATEVDFGHDRAQRDVVAGAVAVRFLDREPGAPDVPQQRPDDGVGDEPIVTDAASELAGEHGAAHRGLVREPVGGVARQRQRSQHLHQPDMTAAHGRRFSRSGRARRTTA